MPDCKPKADCGDRVLTPMETLRLDKTAIKTISLQEADAADKAYWAAQTPRFRLEALEYMRQVAYGYDPVTARLERVLTVITRPSR